MRGRALPRFTAPMVHWLLLRAALLRHAVVMGVRVILLDPQGRVFLVRHSYVPGWHLPGGGVEIGETAHAAGVREVREEAGMAVEGRMALIGLYLNREMASRNHVAVFLARAFSPLADPRPDWEIVERGFFARDALPAATTPATRARLAEALDGALASETW